MRKRTEILWIIENIDQFPEATIRIYNRWGKLLFETKGYDNENNAWNGTYLDADCPTSDYWYIIDIESIDMQMTGHFTLTR
ncbi:MAG: T9SS type B sorting domain-containing protein [Paludibacteraceae bacterium]|nr:T9SS type B sorting domain-containing protein [Paludibacteraceae bacterium]MBR6043946.1 T9SS type B sorting domain-containing protein [Paludibacteraceae bacterium]